jgi:hypothetical protein
MMAATLYPLHDPPTPSHTVGLDYLSHVHVSNGFDNMLIVVDHLTRIAHCFVVYRVERNRIGNRIFALTRSLHITRITSSVGQ